MNHEKLSLTTRCDPDMKSFRLLPVFFAACLPLPADAILLDCEINRDGSYHCIEIAGDDGNTRIDAADKDHDELYKRYLDQARSECTYKEPRKRAGGKMTGAAHRSEELKSARNDYDRCVRDKARALRRQENTATGD